MFFILSKVLLPFILPFTWIIILLFVTLIVKQYSIKKACLITAIIILVIFSNPFLFNLYAKWWDFKAVKIPTTSHYSCGILLGGFTGEDANHQGYFSTSADRFIQAARLREQGIISHILISSGNARITPTSFKEADWVAAQFKDFNIPDSTVIIENRSRNSLENALFSSRLLDSMDLKPPYLLITSAFHMRRARYIFKKEGVDVVCYPCNYIAGKDEVGLDSFIPNIYVLGGWEFYIKEAIGLMVYHFK